MLALLTPTCLIFPGWSQRVMLVTTNAPPAGKIGRIGLEAPSSYQQWSKNVEILLGMNHNLFLLEAIIAI
jgi:hypothetical protein